MSDLEILILSLTVDYMCIDNENNLFRNLPESFTNKIERSVYKRRRKKLAVYTDQIRLKLVGTFNKSEDCFVIDSMPLKVCRLSLSKRSKICKEQNYCLPDKVFCASQQMPYYGYKLHAVCSINGVFQSIDLSVASVHDIH